MNGILRRQRSTFFRPTPQPIWIPVLLWKELTVDAWPADSRQPTAQHSWKQADMTAFPSSVPLPLWLAARVVGLVGMSARRHSARSQDLAWASSKNACYLLKRHIWCHNTSLLNRLAPTSADNVGIADNHHDICPLNPQPYLRLAVVFYLILMGRRPASFRPARLVAGMPPPC
jgi:hypothetical protein